MMPHAYMHVCMYACMHARTHAYIHTYTNACIYDTYMHKYITFVHTYEFIVRTCYMKPGNLTNLAGCVQMWQQETRLSNRKNSSPKRKFT